MAEATDDGVDRAAPARLRTHFAPVTVTGTVTIAVAVTDDDGSVSQQVTTAAVVTVVGVVDGTLYVVGTDGRDHVNIKFNEKKDELKVDVKLHQGNSNGGSDGGSDGGDEAVPGNC